MGGFASSSSMITKLDLLFPYLCFLYGAVMTFVLNSSRLSRIADQRLSSELLATYRGHRGLALVCLVVGGAWILQNLWVA
jgi:hypothetical protein